MKNCLLKIAIINQFGRSVDAASAMNISERRLSSIVTGRAIPSSEEVEKFERFLGLNKEDLQI